MYKRSRKGEFEIEVLNGDQKYYLHPLRLQFLLVAHQNVPTRPTILGVSFYLIHSLFYLSHLPFFSNHSISV